MIEFVCTSIKDAKAFDEMNVERVILCSNIKKGGLTPDLDLIEYVINETKLNFNLLIRKDETDIYNFIDIFKILLFIRKVFNMSKLSDKSKFIAATTAFIDNKNRLHFGQCKIIGRQLAKWNIKNVFNRTFDKLPSKELSLEILDNSNYNEILSNGRFNNSPSVNYAELKSFESKTQNIKFIVGGGVNYEVAKQLFQNDVLNIHVGSAVREKSSFDDPVSKKLVVDFLNLEKK